MKVKTANYLLDKASKHHTPASITFIRLGRAYRFRGFVSDPNPLQRKSEKTFKMIAGNCKLGRNHCKVSTFHLQEVRTIILLRGKTHNFKKYLPSFSC